MHSLLSTETTAFHDKGTHFVFYIYIPLILPHVYHNHYLPVLDNIMLLMSWCGGLSGLQIRSGCKLNQCCRQGNGDTQVVDVVSEVRSRITLHGRWPHGADYIFYVVFVVHENQQMYKISNRSAISKRPRFNNSIRMKLKLYNNVIYNNWLGNRQWSNIAIPWICYYCRFGLNISILLSWLCYFPSGVHFIRIQWKF